MPLSEFLRRARGKVGSDKQETCPANISSRGEDDLVELVWDNGQIVMHGQSSRATRSPIIHSSQSIPTRVENSGVENVATARIGKFGSDESPVVPSGEVDLLAHSDEMVPWLSFPFDDLPPDYCSELLSEVSGVSADPTTSVQHCSVPLSNLYNDGNGLKGSSKSHMTSSWSDQHDQISDPSRASDVLGCSKMSRVNAEFGNSAHGKSVVNDSSFLNFSHFSRPNMLAKSKPPNYDRIPESACIGRRGKEKVSAPIGTNPVKSTLRALREDAQKGIDFDSRPHAAILPKKTFPAANPAKKDQISSTKNDKPVIQNDASSVRKAIQGSQRISEPMVASSSVCSSVVSCSSKRKMPEIEVSEWHSDDMETECIGAKKATASGSSGTKRSRAAEVHNLSERRRRDRINEKMRALQELIPNCNKADKASMLDEAIEYLKTLQLQLQIMSMGAGLCMPPMMFPPGFQHMHPAHAPHFPHMGMGMAMGFGPSMVDLNGGGALGRPIFPIPPVQGAHFPPPIPGHGNFQRIPGSNFPVLGHHHPVQGLHNSVVTSAPSVPFMPPPPASSAMDSNTFKIESHDGTSPTLYQPANPSSLPIHTDEATRSSNHVANQDVLDQPISEQENKPTGDVNNAVTAPSSAAETSGCH